MSKSVCIDIELRENHSLSNAKGVIKSFLKNGWEIRRENKIYYLPIDDEMFNWQEENITDEKLFQIIEQKELQNEIVGLVFYFNSCDTGVSMLMFSHNKISFSLNIERLKLNLKEDVTNVNWYLRRIIPCFGYNEIERILFSQD